MAYTFDVTVSGDISLESASASDPSVTINSESATGAVEIQHESTPVLHCTSSVVSILSPETNIMGNLTVSGVTSSVDSQTVLLANNYIQTNAGYTLDPAQTGGFVAVCNPNTGFQETAVAPGFTTVTVSTTTATGAFVAGNIIQVSGADNNANNGLYEVASQVGSLVTIANPLTDPVGTAFLKTDFAADATDTSAVVTLVEISVLRSNTSCDWQVSSGDSVADFDEATGYEDIRHDPSAVVGPAVAVDDNGATFDGVTGKLIQAGGAPIPATGFGDVV